MSPPKPWTEDRAIAAFADNVDKCLRVALRRAKKSHDRAHLKIIVAANEGRGVTLTPDEVGYLACDDAIQMAAENIAWEVLTGLQSEPPPSKRA